MAFDQVGGQDFGQAETGGGAAGQVASFSGPVTVIRADGEEIPVGPDTAIYPGDTVVTGDGGAVSLVFADDTQFSLGAGGEMTVTAMSYDPASETGEAVFSVAQGMFGFVSGQLAKTAPDAMVIITPVSEIAVRGSSGVGVASPGGGKNTVVLKPDPDGAVGEVVVQTETGAVVLNVPYAMTEMSGAYTPPTYPVALPASVVARMFAGAGGAEAEVVRQAAEAADEAEAAAEGAAETAEATAAEAAFTAVLEAGGTMAEAFQAAADAASAEFAAAGGEFSGGADGTADIALDGLFDRAAEAQADGRSVAEQEVFEQNQTGFPVFESPAPVSVPAPGGPDLTAPPEPEPEPEPSVPAPVVDQPPAGDPTVLTGTPGDDTLNGSAADEIFDGRRGNDIINTGAGRDVVVASEGADHIVFGAGEDTLRFTSFENGGHTVENFNAKGGDKIVFSGLTLTTPDGDEQTDVNFQIHKSSPGGPARNYPNAPGKQDKSIFELTQTQLKMKPSDETNAVEHALDLIGEGEEKQITVGEHAKHIFIIYDKDSNAAVFYFDNTDGDDNIDEGELTLLVFLKDLDFRALSAKNFDFASDDVLVFDLDGDGVELQSAAAGAEFDTDGDGETEATGWFGAGDALLVIDKSGNGRIDGMGEVVSASLEWGGKSAAGAESALDALKEFDTDGNGWIDESDAIYDVLKLWRDENSDGVTDEGELLSLKDFGIARIYLDGENTESHQKGGTIFREARAEKEDGSNVTVADVALDPAAGGPAPEPEDPLPSS